MTEGIDFSWARPGGAAIKAAGKSFVMRYVPYPGDGGKGLTPDEIVDYQVNDLAIGLVFESGGNRVLDGYTAGIVDGRTCARAVIDLALPTTMPFYFAVDFDMQPAQFPILDNYLEGATSVLGESRVGVYGGVSVIDHCFPKIRYLWQTYAWSHGVVSQHADILQYLNGQDINGAVDLCRAYSDDYGQWEADMADPRVDEIIKAVFGTQARMDECVANFTPVETRVDTLEKLPALPSHTHPIDLDPFATGTPNIMSVQNK